MATTDTRSGFRLPWSSDRAHSDATREPEVKDSSPSAEVPDEDHAWPATDPLAEPVASAPVPESPEPPSLEEPSQMIDLGTRVAPAPATPRKPSKLVADLSAAIRSTAEAARDQALLQLDVELKQVVDTIREHATEGSAVLRQRSERDVVAIRDWSKAEVARIREEADARISARKAGLENELARYAASVDDRIEEVQAQVARYQAAMDAYFTRLQDEDDPALLATMAERIPEPPTFDLSTEVDPAEVVDDYVPPTPQHAVEPEPPVEAYVAPVIEPEPVVEAVAVEAVVAPVVEASAEPVVEAAAETEPVVEAEPLVDTWAGPAPEAEPAVEARGESAAEGWAEPVTDAAPEAAAEPVAEPVAEAIADTWAQPAIEAVAEPVAELAVTAPAADAWSQPAASATADEPPSLIDSTPTWGESDNAWGAAPRQPEPEAADRGARLFALEAESRTAVGTPDEGELAVQDEAVQDLDPDAAAAIGARLEAVGFGSPSSADTGYGDTAEPEIRTTQVVVSGLISVASIASFKRHLGRLPGVRSVTVASGPDGEFMFNVSHADDVPFRDSIPTMPGFAARITSASDEVVHVVARDPDGEG